MEISASEAIKIYAKACRARYGRRAKKVVLASAQALRARGDREGVKVWEQVATELDQGEAQPNARAPEILKS